MPPEAVTTHDVSRDRFLLEHLWGWAHRFEAYTPPPRRLFGHYAMPLLWSDEVVGWANIGFVAGRVHAAVGYARRRPQSLEFRRALDAELARMERFLATRDAAGRHHDGAGASTAKPT